MATEKETVEVEQKPKAAKLVRSEKTVDFPSLGWGIHAGETRELPESEAAQQTILAVPFITLIK
jgi:hypothetical protein